jgi:predicted  nucleic acid-binding Zn-ribbon protein
VHDAPVLESALSRPAAPAEGEVEKIADGLRQCARYGDAVTKTALGRMVKAADLLESLHRQVEEQRRRIAELESAFRGSESALAERQAQAIDLLGKLETERSKLAAAEAEKTRAVEAEREATIRDLNSAVDDGETSWETANLLEKRIRARTAKGDGG